MTTRNRRILWIGLLLCTICYMQAKRMRWIGEIGFAMDVISEAYFEKVDRKDLYSAAMRGMARSLDPYSSYIDAEDYTQFQKMMEQEFGGIGVLIEGPPRMDHLTVVTPLYGTPAYHAGIEPGDIILSVNGTSLAGMSIDEASRLMKGPEGSKVVLSIEREGEEKPLRFELVRASIEVESVLGDRRKEDARWDFTLESHPEIGYVRITSFGEKTVEELKRALEQTQSCKGLILDLRDNPGGLLTAATDICDMFLEDGEIVSTKGRDDRFFSSISAEKGVLVPDQVPLVILLNDQSASASEVVAACLQDRKRATIVGERSFGKGSVQNVVELDGGKAAFKLTTARYFPPSGRNIHRSEEAKPEDIWGVTPDEGWKIELDEEEEKSIFARWRKRGSGPRSKASIAKEEKNTEDDRDPQLEKAIEAMLQSLEAL